MKSQYYIISIVIVILSLSQTLTAQDAYIIGPSISKIGETETYYLVDPHNQVASSIDWSIDGVINGAYNESTVEVYWDNDGSNQVGVCYQNALGKYYCIEIYVLVSIESNALTSSDLNYIKTIIPREPTTNISALNNSQKIETIGYYDGLGRLRQQVAKQAGGGREDIITPIVYDNFGRQTKDYLPYVRHSNNSSLNYERQTDEFFNELNNQYQEKYPDDFTTTPNPYSEKVIEASQLSRVLEQGAPGTDWQITTPYHYGHNVKFDYQTNVANEVRLFIVTHSAANKSETNLYLDGYYNPNELSKNVTKDENWEGDVSVLTADEKKHTIEEFVNKQGQVVLKRTYANFLHINDSGEDGEIHNTYYVYDIFGNLTYVLPPKFNMENAAAAATAAAIADGDDGVVDGYGEIPNSELTELCYQYKYDHRNRLVEKKIPGKDWEYIVYDKLDRPVLTQDANLRVNNKWLFTKYDAFGRVVYTGIYTHANQQDQAEMQGVLDTFYSGSAKSYENKQTDQGSYHYYSNQSFPNTSLDVLTVNYYDKCESRVDFVLKKQV